MPLIKPLMLKCHKSKYKGYCVEELSALEKLSEKVGTVLSAHKAQKEELELLRNEVITLKAQNEVIQNDNVRLVEENSMKDLEIEEIISKIESIMA